jgi:hypothetical protein
MIWHTVHATTGNRHHTQHSSTCRRLVLCIRGSLELGDICTDLAARPAAWCLGSLGACNVHQVLERNVALCSCGDFTHLVTLNLNLVTSQVNCF